MVPRAAASISPGNLREPHVPGHPPRPDALGDGAKRQASEQAPHGTPSGSGESPPLQVTLTSNSDAGDPWGPGYGPEGPCARHPPKTLISFSSIPRCPRAWHFGRANPVTPICVSESQGRVFASAGTLRLGSEPSHSGGTGDVEPEACSGHPAAGHSGFLDRQWVLTWRTRWPARGRGQWACVSPPRLPAAALSPGAARAAELSKAQWCIRRVPSGAAQRPGRGRGPPYHTLPPSLGPNNAPFS